MTVRELCSCLQRKIAERWKPSSFVCVSGFMSPLFPTLVIVALLALLVWPSVEPRLRRRLRGRTKRRGYFRD